MYDEEIYYKGTYVRHPAYFVTRVGIKSIQYTIQLCNFEIGTTTSRLLRETTIFIP